MNYICLVYQSEEDGKTITQEDFDEITPACLSWVDELEKNGKHVYSAGLQSPSTSTTMRRRNGEIVVTDGPFAETKEVLGGFTILEARDLNEAILQGMKLAEACRGTVEVRPVFDPKGELTDPIDKMCAKAILKAMKAESKV
jgi:hypothetical protein